MPGHHQPSSLTLAGFFLLSPAAGQGQHLCPHISLVHRVTWSAVVPDTWECQGSLTREIWALSTRPSSRNTARSRRVEHQRWALARAVPLGLGDGRDAAASPGAPGRTAPSHRSSAAVAWRGRGVTGGTVPASLNTKTAITCIFNSPVPPTAARMPGRPPTCAEHPPPQSRRVRSGQGQGLHPGAAGSRGCEQLQGTLHSLPARRSSRSRSHDSRLCMRRGLFLATQRPSVQPKDTTPLFKPSQPCTAAGWHGRRASGASLGPVPPGPGGKEPHPDAHTCRGSPRGSTAAPGLGRGAGVPPAVLTSWKMGSGWRWGLGPRSAESRHTASSSAHDIMVPPGAGAAGTEGAGPWGAVRCRRVQCLRARCGALGRGAVPQGAVRCRRARRGAVGMGSVRYRGAVS